MAKIKDINAFLPQTLMIDKFFNLIGQAHFDLHLMRHNCPNIELPNGNRELQGLSF